jgi:peptidyl-prolyl cis-trans isomerase A (cyclophilin A)
MKRFVWIVGAVLAAFLAAAPASAPTDQLPAGTYAIMKTSMGTMVFRLFPEQAPKTVENFVGLAEGTTPWTDPATGAKSKKPLYDGTIFHRVIRDFMIQGGDPLGIGIGGPGYKFADEFSPDLQFDRPFLLAMANSGPDTNGSQFFITARPTPWLNNRHTIFGELVQGKDVMTRIAETPTRKGILSKDYPEVYAKFKKVEPDVPDNSQYQDRPAKDVVIESIRIERKAAPEPKK